VKDGKILCIGALKSFFSAKKTIDACGGYVTPGGVDSHVHLDQGSLFSGPIGDRFETGTRSAIAGGTTTIICFAFQAKKDETILPVVEAYHKKVRGGGESTGFI
jgi:dihydropyrimidinase